MKKITLLTLVLVLNCALLLQGQNTAETIRFIKNNSILNETFVNPKSFQDHFSNNKPANYSFFKRNNREIDSGLSQQLQAVLDEYVVSYQIKGLSAALSSPNGDIWAGTSGISHDTVELTPDMLLGIGSNTKNCIATIIMQLYEADSLLLSDSLYKYVENYDNIDSTVTIKQLLNHTSGIYNYTNSTALGDSLNESNTRIWTPEELMEYFVLEPSFQPGTDWEYSNTNYVLLGMIIEMVTGNEVVDEIRNRLTLPLGLTSTYLFPDEAYDGFRSHVWTTVNGTLTDVTEVADSALFSIAWTAGAILSTASDMVKWSKGLNEGNLLQDSSLALMRQPAPYSNGTYGLGTQIAPLYTQQIYGHTGSLIYISMCFYVPDDSLSIIILSNQQPAPLNDIWLDLYFAYMEVITDSPEYAETVNVEVYPNPVSSYTSFRFELDRDEFINLSIYNQLGQQVEVLIDENKPAGKNHLQWNTIGLPGGLYTYRLQIGNTINTGKLVLLD